MKPVFAIALALSAAAFLAGCGALSTHQSPKLMQGGEKAWTAGVGAGRMVSCTEEGGDVAFGNACVLMLDPYLGWRLGVQEDGSDPKELFGDRNGEMGIKFSGVPFLGGTLLADVRVQRMIDPVYLTYDFGLSFFPCISDGMFDDEDAPDIVDQEKEQSCGDRPFGAGIHSGFTIGAEWLYVGMKYGIGANSWDGLQLLPGINVGSSFGPKGFKIIPAVDVYFYQWPLNFSPDLRILYGLGLQLSY